MKLLRIAVIATVVLAFASAGFAEHHEMEKGFRADMTVQMKSIQEKLVGLAQETPADGYGWAPAEGVRTTGAVFVHAAAANYFLLSLSGVTLPEGMDIRGMEKAITEKDDVIKALNDSYDFLYKSLEAMSDDDLDKPIKLFGKDATVRMALLICIEHNSEHLGQSIAYARSNGIVPPWSRKAEGE